VVDPLKHTLCYYQIPPEDAQAKGRVPKALGVIDLTNTNVIVDKDPASPENCFKVETPGRDYYIAAADPFKMNTWISVLRLNSKLGTLEKTLGKDGKEETQQAPPLPGVDLDDQYTLSFKLAADKMLQSLSDTAQSSRATLEDVSTMKYNIKGQLKKYLVAVKTQHTESETKLKGLRESETNAHRSLDAINSLIVTLDKFLQASRYIQRLTIATMSMNQNLPTTIRILREKIVTRESSEIPRSLLTGYGSLLTKCFPDSEVAQSTDPSSLNFMQVLNFYNTYYNEIHLPKMIKLEPAKSRRLEVWRKLVASVNGIKQTCLQLSELSLIEEAIKKALNPDRLAMRSRPMSMCDPDEEEEGITATNTSSSLRNIPEDEAVEVKEQPLLGDLGLKLYKSEWKGISKVIQTLGELRSAEKEQSQKLDDALHSRELLASFSSKKTPVVDY